MKLSARNQIPARVIGINSGEAIANVELDANGVQKERTMLVRSEDVEWTDIWNTVGLRGTASDQFALNEFFVRSDHSITREFHRECRESGPLYRMGSSTCYQVGFAGVACGIARGALDSFIDVARNKVPRGTKSPLRDNAVVQSNLAQAEVNLRAARGLVLLSMADIWKDLCAGAMITVEQRITVRMAATNAIHKARELARGLLPVVSDAQGLMSALQQFAGEVEDLFAVSCRFQCFAPVLIHDDSAATHLYYIAREAVNNAIKHSHTKQIVIRLAADEQQGTLAIQDDGAGMIWKQRRIGKSDLPAEAAAEDDRLAQPERVAQPQQQAVVVGPAGIGRRPVDERALLRGVDADAGAEQRDVDAPLVFRAAARRRPVDDELALSAGEYAHIFQIHEITSYVRVEPQQFLAVEDAHGASRGLRNLAKLFAGQSVQPFQSALNIGFGESRLVQFELQDLTIRPRFVIGAHVILE